MSEEQGSNEVAIEFLLYQYLRSKERTTEEKWPAIHTLDLWEYIYRIVEGRISVRQVEKVLDTLEDSGVMKDRIILEK